MRAFAQSLPPVALNASDDFLAAALLKPPMKGRGCPVDTSAEGRSADRAGRRDRWIFVTQWRKDGGVKDIYAVLISYYEIVVRIVHINNNYPRRIK